MALQCHPQSDLAIYWYHAMMKCKELSENAGDYLSGELPQGRRLAVFFHVTMCIHCRRYLCQLKISLESLRELAQERGVLDAEQSAEEIEQTVKILMQVER